MNKILALLVLGSASLAAAPIFGACASGRCGMPSYGGREHQNRGAQDLRGRWYSEVQEQHEEGDYQPLGAPMHMSDADIAKEIYHKFHSDNSFKDVSFKVANGSVSLKGSVEDAQLKRHFVDEIRQMSGVKKVDDQMRVLKSVDLNSFEGANEGGEI